MESFVKYFMVSLLTNILFSSSVILLVKSLYLYRYLCLDLSSIRH